MLKHKVATRSCFFLVNILEGRSEGRRTSLTETNTEYDATHGRDVFFTQIFKLPVDLGIDRSVD